MLALLISLNNVFAQTISTMHLSTSMYSQSPHTYEHSRNLVVNAPPLSPHFGHLDSLISLLISRQSVKSGSPIYLRSFIYLWITRPTLGPFPNQINKPILIFLKYDFASFRARVCNDSGRHSCNAVTEVRKLSFSLPMTSNVNTPARRYIPTDKREMPIGLHISVDNTILLP